MPKDSAKRNTITETDSDSDSGPDDVAPAKKAKTSDSNSKAKTTPDGEAYFELSSKRRVTIREFKGKLYVDIREYYDNQKGQLLPGKKGIMLTTQDWRAMMSVIDEIDSAVKNRDYK